MLEARDLSVELRRGADVRSILTGASLRLQPGEIVGVVGASGSGKSTLGRCLVGLVTPTRGEVFLDGAPLRSLPPARRAAQVQMVFQDPLASLNPRQRIRTMLGEPLRVHRRLARTEVADQLAPLLHSVGLGAELLDRFPHALSGGQAQRVALARALSLEPRFLIADEATSQLDPSVQAQLLELLADLRQSRGLGILFISHDLEIVRQVCDRAIVMEAGKIVDEGPVPSLFVAPRREATRRLVEAAAPL